MHMHVHMYSSGVSIPNSDHDTHLTIQYYLRYTSLPSRLLIEKIQVAKHVHDKFVFKLPEMHMIMSVSLNSNSC